MALKQLSATELQRRMQQEPLPFLLDVREVNEFEYAKIEGSTLIPLNQLPERLDELNPEQEIVVICHHGIRSRQACMFLIHSGFKNVVNLDGGIEAWSCDCDNSVPRY